MSRTTVRWAAIIQICLVIFTGCSPTQPFFVRRDESMANYLDQALNFQYADVQVESLPEATQSAPPFGPNHVPTEFVDLTLEDCLSIALQNSKILRVVPGSNLQTGSVAAALLSAQPGQMPSIFDPAITASTASTQPLAVDNQGNRFNPRGAARANQVGGVEDALSEFDAQFSAVLGYNTTDRPRNVGRDNVFNPQFFQAVDANGQAALSKRLATGTITTARFTTVYSRNNVPASGNAANSNFFGRAVPSDYTAALELQFIQPLGRGRGTLVNRIPIVLARINEDIQLHEFEANIRNLVRDVEHLYWDLYVGYRAYEASKGARESALDLWRVTKRRSELTNTPPETAAQAKALYLQFDNQMKASLWGLSTQGFDPNGLYGREQLLREKMGWSPNDGRLIRPSDEPTEARVAFNYDEILAEGLTRNVDLRRHKWSIKQIELEQMSAKNQMLPQVDLSLIYRWLGVGDEFANADRGNVNFPSPGSTALEELTEGNYQELGARLEFTPQAIGSRRALSGIKNTQLRLAKAHAELNEKEVSFVQQLQSALRNKDSAYDIMIGLRNQFLALDEQINIINQKIMAGQADVQLDQLVDTVARAEQLRAQAQQSYFQTLAEYNKSLVNIHYLKGSLLDLNSIDLGEGAWVEKAYWDAEERSRERAGGIYFDYGFTRPSVVTAGPVPFGGLTEGNISDNGMFLNENRESEGDDEEGPEAVEAQEADELELPEAQPPTAMNRPAGRLSAAVNNPLRGSALRSSGENLRGNPAPVVPASAAGDAGASESFDWGNLGLNSSQAGERTTNRRSPSVVNSQRPIRVISAGGEQPAAEPSAWKPR